MKTTKQTEKNTNVTSSFASACIASCQQLLAQIEKAKVAIFNEFRELRGTHEQLLRLAVNEAEALAWETDFPQLVFPTLAMEKAQAVANWGARQQSIRRLERPLSFAA